MFVFSFFVLGILYIVLAVFVLKKVKFNYFNPHTYTALFSFVFFVIAPLLQIFLLKMDYNEKGVLLMNSMLALFFLFYTIGFLFLRKKIAVSANRILKRFNVKNIPRTTLKIVLFLNFFVAFFLFYLLATKSGYGFFSWILHPRTGYQLYRSSFGHYYILSLACLNVVFLLWLYFLRPQKRRTLFLVTLFFLFLSYFYGSKAIMLGFVVEILLYYNFFIKRIKFNKILLAFLSGILIIYLIMFAYSGSKDFNYKGFLSYFDHYYNGHMFFRDFNWRFEYTYGTEYLSRFWEYVPRSFYPNKPYSYGIVSYVIDDYYPGAGETGNTPAFGGPVEPYLNFGIIGVIIFGLISGYFSSLFYDYFLVYKNFIGFIIFSNIMGFSIFPIIGGGLFILWYFIQFLLLIINSEIIKRTSNKKILAKVKF